MKSTHVQLIKYMIENDGYNFVLKWTKDKPHLDCFYPHKYISKLSRFIDIPKNEDENICVYCLKPESFTDKEIYVKDLLL